ncbi:alpha-mannosidase [Ktedonobacteria bacterium brp13]|nr:alpha-mannosidase [Ktedonobacteria bacterium brp13]
MIHQTRWTIQKITQRLALIEPLVYQQRHTIPAFRFTTLPGARDSPAPLIGADVDDSAWQIIEAGTYWAQWQTNFVLRSHFQIPVDWDSNKPIALYLPLGEAGDFVHPEALAYIDGIPYAACDRYHQEILLQACWQDGQAHTLALHGWTSGAEGNRPSMRPCEIVQIDQPTRDFVATARVALGAARMLDENAPARGKLLHALDGAFTTLDTREPFSDAFYASIAPAHVALRSAISQAGAPLDVTVVATGHAHLDVAWLWTLGQTRRKAGRTFHTVLRLMEQFPDYHFTQSQPQLYDYVRQDYPELFEAIKQRAAEGRWELTGGMWVEADCNLSGPESLARQFLLGRSFFAEHFGPDAETPVLWLPDVFGYAWALPQLIKQAGLEYFFTIKIGWSQYNRLPYDSFWWQGLDGTRVLTHFSTVPTSDGYASTYNAMATAEEVLGTWHNFKQKDLGHGEITPPLLMAFGHGDGGGGPTREMLENIREMAAFPALPHIRQDSTSNFFRELETGSGNYLPTWNGELYLEYHRGTYTTQSRNKRANRKSEFLLHDAEFLATLASLLDEEYAYPGRLFNKAWQIICLNQFHDIIPGSSIHDVYVESQQDYADIRELGKEACDTALQSIARKIDGDLLIINSSSFAREDLAFWPEQLSPEHTLSSGQDGEPIYTQRTSNGTWIAAGILKPCAVTALHIISGEIAIPDTGITVTPTLLENIYLRIELNAAGDITRIYDKEERREVLPSGAIANQFLAFEDRPLAWDAWDVDIFYDDKHWTADPATSVRVVEAGPLRATVEIERRILHSAYTQRIALCYNSPRIDIETTIDWRERHILLKVAFPVDILSPVATYEIQWGNVQRPTHRNTSWDWARFETCAQKWVDLSEGGYGVSLLNDCKYGHDIRDNVIQISLLRGPTYPDPEADQGEQRFTYSLLPHRGPWDEHTIGAAYALNDPVIVYAAADQWPQVKERQITHHDFPSFVAVDQPNIVIETVKRAEDGNGIILRFYESQRQRGNVTLTAGFELAAAWHTNLLEQNQQELCIGKQEVTFSVRPYEIVTLRLVPA